MKIKRCLLQRLVVFAALFTVPFFTTAQQSGDLIGYWKFDETRGKRAVDEVSHQPDSIHYIFNNIKPYNDPVRRNGIAGEALIFDGFSNYIEQPANQFKTPTEAISISVWVAPRAFENGDSGKLSAIINQQNLKDTSGFALGMFRHGRWSFQVGTGNHWLEVWDENHPIPRRQWSYLVATYDAINGSATLYLNGEPISQKILFHHLPIKPAAQPLVIGKHNQPVRLDAHSKIDLNMFNGLMDELKVYNRV